MKLSDFPEIILATSKVSDGNLSFVQGDLKEVLENRKKFLNSNKAIGLVHAGWKGLDLGIIDKTIKLMRAKFGTTPENLLVYIGPSIGPYCYKNSPTFKQRSDPKWQPFILQENGNFNLDLWAFTENQLKEAGVLSENIENPKICTYHSGEYFSHRKADDEKLAHDYRFATVLGIKK